MLILNPFLAIQSSLGIVGSHKYRLEPFYKELWLCSLPWPDIVPRQSIPVTTAIKCQENNLSRKKKENKKTFTTIRRVLSVHMYLIFVLFVIGAEVKNSKAFVKSNAIMFLLSP